VVSIGVLAAATKFFHCLISGVVMERARRIYAAVS
jgi:hypothetical protein